MIQEQASNKIDYDQLSGYTHVWYAQLDKFESKVDFCFHLLSLEEKNRVEKFKFDNLRRDWILTRGLLRVFISNYLKFDPKKIEFEYNEFGKPFIVPNSESKNLSFNLSHSDGVVVFAFTRHKQVGIDVEKIGGVLNFPEVIELVFHNFEKEWFSKIPTNKKNEIFYKLWTSKEAYIKAIGKGLSFSPNKVSLELDSEENLIFKDIACEKDLTKWKLVSFKPFPDYISSIVVEDNDTTIEQLTLNTRDINDNFSLMKY